MMTWKSVDDYIKNAPAETQKKLREIRAIIKFVAPQAEEKISYAIPYYGYRGRLVYFGYAKKHIGVYLRPPVIEKHLSDLKDYVTSKAGIQFPLDKKLPVALIKKLVKAGIKNNEALKNSKRDRN